MGDFHLETSKMAKGWTVPMILHCPQCGERHIDEEAFARVAHHTHACQGCGFIWRPAKINTHGVRFLPGYKNGLDQPDPIISRIAEQIASGEIESQQDTPHGK